DKALGMARDRDLDLVEVAVDASPTVARPPDYSKYKYEQEQKAKAARKHQQQVNVREIKLRPKIADHDYETKKGHVERFLRHKDKVKVTIMFRGREQAHPERGRALLQRLYEDITEIATIESEPQQEGRNMHMMLAPSKELLAQQQRDGEAEAEADEAPGAQDGAAEPASDAPDSPDEAADTPDAAGTPEDGADAADAADTPEDGADAADTADEAAA
ncbi:MAG: translation initiation factor IF-3, partial [Solirubrobacterales bacterium]